MAKIQAGAGRGDYPYSECKFLTVNGLALFMFFALRASGGGYQEDLFLFLEKLLT